MIKDAGMLLLLSVLLEIIFAGAFSLAFQHRRSISLFLSTYLIGFSHLLLIFNGLNLLGWMNVSWMVLILQTISIGMLFIFIRGRKTLIAENWRMLKTVWKQAEGDSFKIVTVLLVVVMIAVLALNIVLIYVVPPNNNDSQGIHVARVIEWYQRGSFFPWETSRIWQLTFPLNAEILYFWTVVFTDSWHFLGYVPLLSGLMCGLVISGLFYEEIKNKWLALFVGLIWLTFPVVQLNLTSTRHDHVSTALVLICFAYLYYGFKDQDKMAYIWSGLAMGIAVGTNFAVAMYIPGFGLLAFYLLIKKEARLRVLLVWAGASLLSFLILSSPIYISNWVHFDSVLPSNSDEMTIVSALEESSLVEHIGINSFRWLYQMVDFTGLPNPLLGYCIRGKATVTRTMLDALNIENIEGSFAAYATNEFSLDDAPLPGEDEAWYGLLGTIVLLPWMLVAFITGLKTKNFFSLSAGFFFVTVLITTAFLRSGWAPYYSRYFLPLSGFCLLTIANWFRGKKGIVIQIALLVLAVFTLWVTIRDNPAKPVVGDFPIWEMTTMDKLTLQTRHALEMLQFAERTVPEETTLAYAGKGGGIYEFGLYGENLSRKVVKASPIAQVCDPAWLQEHEIEYVLIQLTDTFQGCGYEYVRYLDSAGQWMLLQVK